MLTDHPLGSDRGDDEADIPRRLSFVRKLRSAFHAARILAEGLVALLLLTGDAVHSTPAFARALDAMADGSAVCVAIILVAELLLAHKK
jgi:hypothetical protein